MTLNSGPRLVSEQAKLKNIQTDFTLKNQINESRRAVEKLELQLENNRHVGTNPEAR